MKNQMKLEFLSKSINEAFARSAVAAFLVQADPTLEELADVKTAVSEAVTNAIVHAYRDCNGKISITATLSEDNSFSVRITDYGRGIPDIEKAIEPLYTDSKDTERSGMGFTVMETFMDSMTVESSTDKGTTVTLTKKIGSESDLI